MFPLKLLFPGRTDVNCEVTGGLIFRFINVYFQIPRLFVPAWARSAASDTRLMATSIEVRGHCISLFYYHRPSHNISQHRSQGWWQKWQRNKNLQNGNIKNHYFLKHHSSETALVVLQRKTERHVTIAQNTHTPNIQSCSLPILVSQHIFFFFKNIF